MKEMNIRYVVHYKTATGKSESAGFHTLELAKEFAELVNGAIVSKKY